MMAALEHGATVLVTARGGNLMGQVITDIETVPGLGRAHKVAMENGDVAYCGLGLMFDLTKRAPKRCHISAVMGNC